MKTAEKGKATETKPTQLPWKPGSGGTVYALENGELVAIAQFHPREEFDEGKWPETQANIHLVCRAVNSHKDMIYMLKMLLPKISERDAIRDEVDDLIAKAEGKATV